VKQERRRNSCAPTDSDYDRILMHSLFSDLCQRSIFPFDCG
jgi:hypothetical protein